MILNFERGKEPEQKKVSKLSSIGRHVPVACVCGFFLFVVYDNCNLMAGQAGRHGWLVVWASTGLDEKVRRRKLTERPHANAMPKQSKSAPAGKVTGPPSPSSPSLLARLLASPLATRHTKPPTHYNPTPKLSSLMTYIYIYIYPPMPNGQARPGEGRREDLIHVFKGRVD